MKYINHSLTFLFLFFLSFSHCNSQNKKEETNNSKSISFDTLLFKSKEYYVLTVKPELYNIELFNQIDKKSVHTFESIHKLKLNNKEELLFAMNAGMYHKELYPVGLYIANGKTIYPINLDSIGNGNFYELPPNGVFCITSKDSAVIVISKEYEKLAKKNKIKLATQSGPMLVIENKFNLAFREDSKNFNIRNGVGINDKGEVVFAISNNKVNFFEFSQLFRDKLHCENALYLDGFVSQWFIPKIHEPKVEIPLGPIITVSKKKKK